MKFIPQQFGLLAKSPLTILVEQVEDKYGSVENAPESAMAKVHKYVRDHGMGGNYKMKSHMSKNITRYRRKYKKSTSRTPTPVSIWAEKGQWYCNEHHVVKAAKMLRKHPYLSPSKAAIKNNCNPAPIIHSPIFHYYYEYTLGSIKRHANDKRALLKELEKSKCPLIPQSLEDLNTHAYLGSVHKCSYCAPLHYKAAGKAV